MQLSNPHKQAIEKIYRSKEKNINGIVMLDVPFIHTNQTNTPLEIPVIEYITHFPTTYSIKNNTNIPTKHNEPFVRAMIIDTKTNKRIQFQDGNTINIPAKAFYNTNTDSKLFLKTIKGKKYNFSLICTNNPNLKENNFKEQFDTCINFFYKLAPVNNHDDIETLINSNIITSGTTFVAGVINIPGIINICPIIACEMTNQHRENGCSSEEKFVQQIIDSSPLKTGHNTPTKNIYTSLIGREYGNKGLFRKPQ
jgi:hypothetical protein